MAKFGRRKLATPKSFSLRSSGLYCHTLRKAKVKGYKHFRAKYKRICPLSVLPQLVMTSSCETKKIEDTKKTRGNPIKEI